MGVKFRVWCANKKEFEKHPVLINQIGDIYHFDKNIVVPTRKDTHIIQTFTGLHDKNGKEIYEGDIVECREPYNDLEVAVIRWDDKLAKFVFDMYYDGETEITETLDADNWISVNHFEIVGNIYENPELLGDS